MTIRDRLPIACPGETDVKSVRLPQRGSLLGSFMCQGIVDDDKASPRFFEVCLALGLIIPQIFGVLSKTVLLVIVRTEGFPCECIVSWVQWDGVKSAQRGRAETAEAEMRACLRPWTCQVGPDQKGNAERPETSCDEDDKNAK